MFLTTMSTSKQLREKTAFCELEYKFWPIDLPKLTVNVPQMSLRYLDRVKADFVLRTWQLFMICVQLSPNNGEQAVLEHK